jgi:hypothetical protein
MAWTTKMGWYWGGQDTRNVNYALVLASVYVVKKRYWSEATEISEDKLQCQDTQAEAHNSLEQ